MSRLDDHVSAVQNRLALRLFIKALAWLSVGFAGVVLLAVLFDRILQWHLPRPNIWAYSGAGVVVIAAICYAIYRRPTAREAAVPIDQKLGLKEKISTALFIRRSDDPFAQAAVKDAEQAAGQVVLKLNEHFPLSFPKPLLATCAIALMALMSTRIDPLDLFHRRDKLAQQQSEQKQLDNAKTAVQQALATVNSMPVTESSKEPIDFAKAQLSAELAKPINDAGKANRTAVRALQDLNEALNQQIKNSAKYAEAQNEMKMMRSMQKPNEGQGPVADAHRAMSEGKFTEALDDLQKAVENFDKLDKSDQQKSAEQMKQLAQQLQQMANNPAQQDKMQQQMQQMGLNKQQAQQAQQMMQQAAQGNQQAAKQLQQMAQQAMQQAGMNQQQQQQMQQMMQQMQAQANSQNQAQQMQQAAQQMAQAMQQAAQQQPGQAQQQQQSQAQQQQQGQGQNPAQQQQQAQGQGQGQPSNSQMGQAMAAMQQQLQQMQASAQDAQQVAAAQQAAQQGQANAQQAMNGANTGGDQSNMRGNRPGGGPGQWSNNNNRNFNGPNNGPGGGGVGAGERPGGSPAPYGVKPEIDPSQEDEKGKILASTFIKDFDPLKGKSTEALKEIATKALNDPTDEVDQERISRQAQNAVKQYFKSMSNDKP